MVCTSTPVHLSSVTERFTESVIREMTRLCDAHGGINLAQGFPDFPPPQELIEEAARVMRDKSRNLNQYPVTYGEPVLRRAIADRILVYNGIKADPDTEITVTCGATEAMMATLRAVIEPGDEVIIFEPFYENYGPDSILSGATPRFVRLYPPNWTYRYDELASAFNSRTKAIIINTPHNPTGKVFSQAELNEISELCKKWNCLAVTDEVYEYIVYDGRKHISMASLPEMSERTVTISSASKTYSVTGWRIGWVIAPKYITARIRKVHDFLTVGAPTPLQYGVACGLRFPESYYTDLASRYQKARDYLYQTLKEAGFEPSLPEGAYYIMADTSKVMEQLGVTDDFALSRALIAKTGVASVPGFSFYSGQKITRRARFCFSKQEETLRRAARALVDGLGRA